MYQNSLSHQLQSFIQEYTLKTKTHIHEHSVSVCGVREALLKLIVFRICNIFFSHFSIRSSNCWRYSNHIYNVIWWTNREINWWYLFLFFFLFLLLHQWLNWHFQFFLFHCALWGFSAFYYNLDMLILSYQLSILSQ